MLNGRHETVNIKLYSSFYKAWSTDGAKIEIEFSYCDIIYP